MKIKITGHRMPWIDGKARDHGYVATVDAALGAHLVENGLAEEILTRARKGDGTYQGDDPSTPENEAYNPPKKTRKAKK